MINFTQNNLEAEGIAEGDLILIRCSGVPSAIAKIDDDYCACFHTPTSQWGWSWEPDCDDATFERIE